MSAFPLAIRVCLIIVHGYAHQPLRGRKHGTAGQETHIHGFPHYSIDSPAIHSLARNSLARLSPKNVLSATAGTRENCV